MSKSKCKMMIKIYKKVNFRQTISLNQKQGKCKKKVPNPILNHLLICLISLKSYLLKHRIQSELMPSISINSKVNFQLQGNNTRTL
jgi:hypothetical protein